jgi:hypothetical protein
MRRLAALLLAAVPALAQTVPAARVATDAKVIDRVAEASKKDLPRELLRRIVEEDIELLRGKRPDGTYQFAGYERLESGRVGNTFSVDPGHRSSVLEVTAPAAYRLTINVPSRRMLVTKNKRVFIERVDIESIPANGSAKKTQSVELNAWIEPGQSRNVDLDEISRQATARVSAKADDTGYGNVTLTLIQARIFDNPDSPYAEAVQAAKAILRALDHDDVGSIRAMAGRIGSALQAPAAASVPASIDVIATRADSDNYADLQAIEDLLTGSEAERRQGLDRLHQLLRKMRK